MATNFVFYPLTGFKASPINLIAIGYYLSSYAFFISSLAVYLFPSLLLFNGDSNGESNDNLNSGDSENSTGNEEDPEDDDNDDEPEKSRTIIRDNPHAPIDIMDDRNMVDAALKGNPEALEETKLQYSSFFENNDDKEGLDQVKAYLASEYISTVYATVEEDLSSDNESDSSKESSNSRDEPNSSGPSASGSGPNSSGPSASGPNSSTSGPDSSDSGPNSSGSSTGSSRIMEVLVGLLLLGGGILDSMAEVFGNLFS